MTKDGELVMNPTLPNYDQVDGTEALEMLLINYYHCANDDPIFAKAEHFILYCFGDQRSLIRVDTSKTPFFFWYYDLQGRPITKAVKETLAQFLWEYGGEKNRFVEIYNLSDMEVS